MWRVDNRHYPRIRRQEGLTFCLSIAIRLAQRGKLWECFGKDAPFTVGIVTEEFANLDVDVNGTMRPGQVGKCSVVMTVDPTGRMPAVLATRIRGHVVESGAVVQLLRSGNTHKGARPTRAGRLIGGRLRGTFPTCGPRYRPTEPARAAPCSNRKLSAARASPARCPDAL